MTEEKRDQNGNRFAVHDLLDSCEEILDCRGGADSPLDDEYVMERLRAAVAMTEEKRDQLEAENQRLLALVDPPVCRRQFPDGHVPGNAKEAAEGWKQWADKYSAELSDEKAENKHLREALFMCAAHCQGGNSAAGRAAAELLGVPFPIRMAALENAAISEGLDPEKLWPWWSRMCARTALKSQER